MTAAQHGQSIVVEILLQHGGSLDMQNEVRTECIQVIS